MYPPSEPFFAHESPVDTSFFARDAREVARDLLGCVVATGDGARLCAGIAVECEAYLGPDDPGSHAATKAPTERNRVMYAAPGTVYVYFAYGNHHMLNLVCGPPETASAVLLRALEPVAGLELMALRRGTSRLQDLCRGPGRLAQALGVNLADNGTSLEAGRIRVYAGTRRFSGEIATSGRIGLSTGHEPQYRYYIADSPFVSRGRTGPARRRGQTPRGKETA